MYKPSLIELLKALQHSWSSETSSSTDWSPKNPARGQCVVSSLVLQDYLDGDFARFETIYNGARERHYANLLDGGVLLDATRSQYPAEQQLTRLPLNLKSYSSQRAKFLAEQSTKERYQLLKSKVERALGG